MADNDLWATAQNLHDVASATIAWLNGEISETPTYLGPPDDETKEIRDHLVWLNNRGFLTGFSQPARKFTEGSSQRAALCGFCFDPDIAFSLEALGIASDLIVIALPFEAAGGTQITITIDEYRPYTWLGFREPSDDGFFLSALGSGARLELLASTWIALIDPVWGREDYLWDRVRWSLTEGVGRFNPIALHEDEEGANKGSV